MSPRSFVPSDSVIVSGRVAAMLEHHLGAALTDVRQRFRGKDPELDDVLLGLRTAAVMFVDQYREGFSSANGTQAVPIAEPAAEWELLTTTAVSDLVDLEERSVRKAAIEGRLRGCKVSGAWRFTARDVADWRATTTRGAHR